MHTAELSGLAIFLEWGEAQSHSLLSYLWSFKIDLQAFFALRVLLSMLRKGKEKGVESI